MEELKDKFLNSYQSEELTKALNEIKQNNENLKLLEKKIVSAAEKTENILKELSVEKQKNIKEYKSLSNQMHSEEIDFAFLYGIKFADSLKRMLIDYTALSEDKLNTYREEIICRYLECRQLKKKFYNIIIELKKSDKITNSQYYILEDYVNISTSTILLMINIIDRY